MEHPVLFLSILLEKLGLPIVHSADEAHTFLQKLLLPHVVYTWVVAAVLLILAKLAVSRLELVPSGGAEFLRDGDHGD